MSIVFFPGLPIPPSSNHQYFLARRGSKTYHVSSEELKRFKKNMQYVPYLDDSFESNKKLVLQMVENKQRLEIKALFRFHHYNLYTKSGEFKKMDVSNRLKALHDQLCKLLGIDDSLFFKVSAEKIVCDIKVSEECDVAISEI